MEGYNEDKPPLIQGESDGHHIVGSREQEEITNPKLVSGGKIQKLFRAAAFGALLLVKDQPEQTQTFEQKRDKAKIEMEEGGVTSEQRAVYKYGLTDVVHKAIHPVAIFPGDLNAWKAIAEETLRSLKEGRNEDINPTEEDAWRLYLGLPQTHHTFGISDFQPPTGGDGGYYFKINDFRKEFDWHDEMEEQRSIKSIVNATKNGPRLQTTKRFDPLPYSMIMHRYYWTSGQDNEGSYIAYYDTYDFDMPVEKNGFIGKPFKIYDRIYYDPITFRVIAN